MQPSNLKTPISADLLLEQHAEVCMALVPSSAHPRVKRFLRLLAVDLMIEAEKQRRTMARRKVSEPKV